MDELELLKKDWKTRIEAQVSKDDIYKMLHKKSSSKVKWIFYISVIELLIGVASIFWSFSHPNEEFVFDNDKDYSWTIYVVEILMSFILIYFTIKFYKNYKKISVNDSAKKLIENIINARKTVKNYIKVGLSVSGIFAVVVLFLGGLNSPAFQNLLNDENHFIAYLILIAVIVVVTGFIVGIGWLFYQLIYGLLLRNLYKNYKEIKKLEI